jgi:hypothetical protein
MTSSAPPLPLPLDGETDLIMAMAVEMSPEEMEAIEAEAQRKADELAEMLNTLAGSIEKKFGDRSSRRSVKEAEWIDSYRLYLGTLGAGNKLSTPDGFFGPSKAGNRPIEHNLVKQKCKTAIAQGLSSQFAGGDKNWDIAPSPSPDIDPTEAAIKAEAMENEIYDQLNATKYGYKCRQAYEDRVVLGTGVIKGPSPSIYAALTYELVDDGMGNTTPIPVHRPKNKPVLFRVDPWFFFPDDTVNDIDDAEDAIELHPMSRSQLIKLKKNPGFMGDALDELISEEPREYTNQTFSEYASLTASGSNVFRNKYAVLEYHGPVTRTQLDMLDIDPSYDSTNEVYFGEVWVCQGKVIRVELEALAGMFELPYCVCPWLNDPGSIFGFGLPQEIKDPQRMANTALQMILTNASDSSGSIFVINTELLEDPDGTYELRPRKILTTTDYTIQNMDQAIKDYTVPNITGSLLPILGLAREFAQEESGTPSIAAGIDSPQTGSDSATGLAILNQNSTTINDYLNEAWDDRMTYKIINRMYHYNMQFNPKPEILGDFEVDVRSSTNLRQQQMAARDMEKISVEAGQNPEMAKILNMQNLTKARISSMHIPNVGIIKSDAQIQEEAQAAAENPPPDYEMMKLEIMREELEVRKMEAQGKMQQMQIEAQKIQFEMGANQQREMWQHDERMQANAVRMQEAQARVIEAQTNREIEMIQLAQTDEANRQKIMADLQKNNTKVEADLFMAGQDLQIKAADQQLVREELKVKQKQGSGI